MNDAASAGMGSRGEKRSWHDGPAAYALLFGVPLCGQIFGVGGILLNAWLVYLAFARPARAFRFSVVTALSYLAGVVIVFGVGYAGAEGIYLEFVGEARLEELRQDVRNRGASAAVMGEVPLRSKDTFELALAMGTSRASPFSAIPLLTAPLAILVLALGCVYGIIGHLTAAARGAAPDKAAATVPPRSRALRLLERGLLVWAGVVAVIAGVFLFFLPTLVIYFGLRAI